MSLRKVSIFLFAVVAALIVTAPLIVYGLGISNVQGRPTKATKNNISVAEAEVIWRELKESGPVHVTPISPYNYLYSLLMDRPLPPGSHLALYVARQYNIRALENRRMIWWHTSGAALTIWLTRNWSTEELLAKAYEIHRDNAQLFNSSLHTDPIMGR